MTTAAEVLELFAEAARWGARRHMDDGLRWVIKATGHGVGADVRERSREVKKQWTVAARMARAERRAYLLSLPPLEIRSGVCATCGAVVEHRHGVAWPVHIGQAASRCRRA